MSDNIIRPAQWLENGQRSLAGPAPEAVAQKTIDPGGRGPHDPGMDLTEYRLDQNEKQIEAVSTHLSAITAAIGQVQASIATLNGRLDTGIGTLTARLEAMPTRESNRNATIALGAVVIASALAVGALLFAASSNQLSAFQAGISMVQTGIAVNQPPVK